MEVKKMIDNNGDVKDGIFCITLFILFIFIPIFLIAIGRYTKQQGEIEKLEKQIENQQIIIDYLQNGSDENE